MHCNPSLFVCEFPSHDQDPLQVNDSGTQTLAEILEVECQSEMLVHMVRTDGLIGGMVNSGAFSVMTSK